MEEDFVLLHGWRQRGKSSCTTSTDTRNFPKFDAPKGAVAATNDLIVGAEIYIQISNLKDATTEKICSSLLPISPALSLTRDYAKEYGVVVSEPIEPHTFLPGFAKNITSVAERRLEVSLTDKKRIYVEEQGGFVGLGVIGMVLGGLNVIKGTPAYDEISREGYLPERAADLAFKTLVESAPGILGYMKPRITKYRDLVKPQNCSQLVFTSVSDFFLPDQKFKLEDNEIAANMEAYANILIASATATALLQDSLGGSVDVTGWPIKVALHKADFMLPLEQNLHQKVFEQLDAEVPGVLKDKRYKFWNKEYNNRQAAVKQQFGDRYDSELVPALNSMQASPVILDDVANYCRTKFQKAYDVMAPILESKGVVPVNLAKAELKVTSLFTGGLPTYSALRLFTG